MRLLIVSLLAFLSASAALAQGGPQGGPGPVPQPWGVNFPTIYYNNGGVTLPASVAGGTKGAGTINVQGLYLNGSPLGVFTSVSSPLGLSSGVVSLSYGNGLALSGGTTLQDVLPVQSPSARANYAFGASDLYKETRRSNLGLPMADTFPASTTTGLIGGTRIQLNNVDATASDTLTAGSGTSISGSGIVGPGRSSEWVYDAPNTTWRPTMNSLTAVLGPASAAANHLATFADTTGKVLQDAGAIGSLATASPGVGLALAGTSLNLQPPTLSTLGGIEAIAPIVNYFISSISTAGVPSLSPIPPPAGPGLSVKAAAPPAKGDGVVIGGASTTASSATITDGSASFTNADIGKRISLTYENSITVTVASPAVFTWSNNSLAAGDTITLFTSGALPTGLSPGTIYYVIASGLTTNQFELSAAPGGAAVNTSGVQSGAHFAISSAGFSSTISAVNSATSVTAAVTIPSTNSNATIVYGTDDTASFIAAAAASPLIYAPHGVYMLSSAVTFQAADGEGIIGDGTGSTEIYLTSTTAKGFVYQSADYPQMQNLNISRIGTAQSGATNIDVSAPTAYGIFNNLFVQHGFDNIILGGTVFGYASNIITQTAMSNGLHLTNTASGEPLQWQLYNIIAGENTGSGFFAECVSGSSAFLGEWVGVETFGNAAYGVYLLGGSGCPVGDARFTNMFLGSDGLGELVLDTHGGTAVIQGASWFEGGAGACINQTASAGHVSVQGVTLNTCGAQGAEFSGSSFEITGGNILSNGGAGIFANTGTTGIISNARFAGNLAGVVISNGASNVSVTNNNMASQTNPITPGTGLGNIVTGNIGYNPVGGASLSPSASPWTFTNGPTPSTIYLSSTGAITGVNTQGVAIPATGASIPMTLQLGPNETAIIAYAGTLSAKAVVH